LDRRQGSQEEFCFRTLTGPMAVCETCASRQKEEIQSVNRINPAD